MTGGEQQGLGLLPKGLGSRAKKIYKVGRTGPSPAGAGPTIPSEEAGQARGQPQTEGIRHTHGDEAGLRLSWEDKFTGQDQVSGTGTAAMQLQYSSDRATCKSLSLKQLPSKYGRRPHWGLFLQVTSTKASSVSFSPRQPAVLSLGWLWAQAEKHSESQQQQTNKRKTYWEHLLQSNIHSLTEFSVITEVKTGIWNNELECFPVFI